MLVAALDEFRQGRMLEVADILASRARYLSYGLDKSNISDDRRRWEVAREPVAYTEEQPGLVSNATVDASLKLVDKRR